MQGTQAVGSLVKVLDRRTFIEHLGLFSVCNAKILAGHAEHFRCDKDAGPIRCKRPGVNFFGTGGTGCFILPETLQV